MRARFAASSCPNYSGSHGGEQVGEKKAFCILKPSVTLRLDLATLFVARLACACLDLNLALFGGKPNQSQPPRNICGHSPRSTSSQSSHSEQVGSDTTDQIPCPPAAIASLFRILDTSGMISTDPRQNRDEFVGGRQISSGMIVAYVYTPRAGDCSIP